METLVNTAIIGTGQVPAAQFSTDLPIDEIIEQLTTESPEQQLLLAAGSASIYQRAGYVPAQFPDQLVIAEPEELPYCSAKIEKHLESLLGTTSEASLDTVLQEALQLMQEAHLLLPARLLPLALNLKRSDQKHRAILYPLLGKRGLWLSQFQAVWAWVGQYAEQQSATLTSDKETIWQEGTIEQRQEILRQMREVDPEQARSWLANTWRQERAEVRKALLTTLEQHLTQADEDFLEQALSDRSKEVQKKAAELLAQLPTSAFSQRMQTRAATLLSYQDEHIQITIPETLDTFWTHDGLDGKSHADLKNSVNWISQILGFVPLTFWETHFACKPDQLTLTPANNAEEQTVILGWCQAAQHFPNSAWLFPLWRWLHQIDNKELNPSWLRSAMFSLLEGASQQESESLVISGLDYGDDWQDLQTRLRNPWSQEFSRFFLERLALHLQTAKDNQYFQDSWYGTLPGAATAIAPDYLSIAFYTSERIIPKDKKIPYWDHQIKQFRDILRMRQQIREGLQK